MAITHKDINLLTQKATIAGTEKIPISDTEYVTPNQIASLGGGGVSDVTLGGTSVVSNGVAVLPSYPDITGKQDVIDSSNKLGYELVDTSALQQKSSVDGTEEIPVSGTEYITPTQTVIGGSAKTTLTPFETVSGKWIDLYGNEQSQSSMSYWKYNVTPGKTYLFGGRYGSNMSTAKFVTWFNRNFTFISYEPYGGNGESTVSYSDQPVVAPANAFYLVLNIQNYYDDSGRYYLKAVGDIIPGKTSELINDSGFKKITISSSEPTSSDGSDGDIWIVI